MGKLTYEISNYGAMTVTTPEGAAYRLGSRDGRLEIRTLEGHLAIIPQTSNVVQVAIVDDIGREMGRV